MPTTKLTQNVLEVVLPSHQARKLTRIAEDKGVTVSQLVNEVLGPLLAEGESEGRCVLLYINEDAYQAHLDFFDGDVELALNSMAGSVEVTGDDFAHSMRTAGED
jgi:hypothetical protein